MTPATAPLDPGVQPDVHPGESAAASPFDDVVVGPPHAAAMKATGKIRLAAYSARVPLCQASVRLVAGRCQVGRLPSAGTTAKAVEPRGNCAWHALC
jgi:hypothetical protein